MPIESILVLSRLEELFLRSKDRFAFFHFLKKNRIFKKHAPDDHEFNVLLFHY